MTIARIKTPTNLKPTIFVPKKIRIDLEDVIVIETTIIAVVRVVEAYPRRNICEITRRGAQSLREGRHPPRKIETTLISGDADEKDRHHLLHLTVIPSSRSKKPAPGNIRAQPGGKIKTKPLQNPTKRNHLTPTL